MKAPSDPFMKHLGLEAQVPEPGKARVWGILSKEHLNAWGSAHGGYVYTLADAAFALASNSHGALAVSISTHMEYLRPAKTGERLEAEATEVYLGRRTSVYRVEVRGSEDLVAVFTGTAYRKPNQSSPLFPHGAPHKV